MVKIDSVDFGEVKINGKIYYSDIIAWWDDKFEEIEKFRVFDEDFFERLMKRKPEVMIILKGLEDFVEVQEGLQILAKRKKVLFFEEGKDRALSLFKAFLSDGKKAVLVIHNM
ncbi:MAG: hypothetical protein JW716_01745 [Candidatus Aenigmarchaeota archaeon]|nr:hypothetical protein [Candidatus Aenigmarchaeota archaeon]